MACALTRWKSSIHSPWERLFDRVKAHSVKIAKGVTRIKYTRRPVESGPPVPGATVADLCERDLL